MDAITLGLMLEALNNKARQTDKNDSVAWDEVLQIQRELQNQLDTEDIHLAVCWLNKCIFHDRDIYGQPQVHESAIHDEGFILVWN